MLLLNRVLTVTPGKPASHRGRGWEPVTARAIEALVERGGPLVAILWGRDARGLVPHLPGGRLHRVAAPEPAVGARRLLRVAAVQPRQRAARRAGRGPRRLEAPVTPRRRAPAGSGPATSRSATRSPRGCPTPTPADPDGYVGWADRLAHHLDAARRAASTCRSATPTSPCAAASSTTWSGRSSTPRWRCSPTSSSMVGGGNDLLRPQVDLDGLAAAARGGRGAAPARRRRRAARDARPTPADAGLFKALRGRHAVHTANLFTIAQQHGCYVLNQWGMAALRDWRMWADDRIHLTTEGHRRVALGRALRPGAPHRPGRLDHPAAAGRPRPPAATSCAATPPWARTHAGAVGAAPPAGPLVRRRACSAKRPRLQHFRDPEGEPTHQSLPEG